jgi:hypothetical protein
MLTAWHVHGNRFWRGRGFFSALRPCDRIAASEAMLCSFAAAACAEMATAPVPTKLLRRQDTPRCLPMSCLEVCGPTCSTPSRDGHV